MAIQPPSDIVLDVLNNADPSAVLAAQEKLKAGQAAAQAQRLSATDRSFEAAMNTDKTDGFKVRKHLDGVDKKQVPETYRKFEAMVLQNFIKTMLPDSDIVYGKGATGEIWKGMMAEQLANEIAKNGGIGIADHLGESAADKHKVRVEKAEANRGDRMHMATQIIEENQLKALDKLLPGDTTTQA